MTTLHKTMIKALLLIGLLFITAIATGQNVVKETETSVILNGIEFMKDAKGFNNLFELKSKSNKINVNLNGYGHAFKVVHVYNNKTVIKITNSSYYTALATQKYIKSLNKTHLIKFIR